MNISINTKELTNILEMTPGEQNLMLVGKHGIGKSEIITSYFMKNGQKVITLFLGQMSDPGDLIGLPSKDRLNEKTEFLPPYWFPTDGQPIVLFLDELNRARPEVLQTIMDLTLNRKLAGKALPKGSRVISAINEGEEYQLTDLDPALLSRFNVYNFRPSTEEWLLWATEHQVDERILTFIQNESSYLDGIDAQGNSDIEKTPDRRSWTRVSGVIQGIKTLSPFHKKVIAGMVGMNAANKFFASLAQNKSISGKDLLGDYAKYQPQVEKMELHQLSVLNESIFRYIETDGYQLKNKVKLLKNLSAYFNDFESSGNSEAIAHFVSLFSSNNYPRTIVLVLTETPDLYEKIQKFINNL
jgi:hypothetical protein